MKSGPPSATRIIAAMVPRSQAMALKPAEFIRRFLLHVLARGFHRIRHYGLFASAARKDNLARAPPASGRAPTNDPRFHRKWRRFGTMAPLPVFSHAPRQQHQDHPGELRRGPVRFARTSGRYPIHPSRRQSLRPRHSMPGSAYRTTAIEPIQSAPEITRGDSLLRTASTGHSARR